jgi:NADPH:quinone reductase-like Zn-dependent oxidoreductase
MRPGDAVALNAASSSVGLAAIHTANRVGATPIAVTRTSEKKERLLKEGAAEVIVSDEEDVAARLLDLTGGKGVEYVFDAVAGPGVTDLARVVAPGGTHFLYGGLSGQPTPYPGFTLGMPALNMRTYTVLETTKDPVRLSRAAAFVASGLRNGAFRPVVDRLFPLEEIVRAHQHMESNTQFGKIVVTAAR